MAGRVDEIIRTYRCMKRINPTINQSVWKKSKQDRLIINQYNRERRAINVQARIADNLRSRVWRALNNQSCIKQDKTLDILGCSIAHLKTYLESLWRGGMSWDNYGVDGWHIDHVRPCSWFNLADPQQQRDCFHYTNLQPLWAHDNLSKGNRWSGREWNPPLTPAELDAVFDNPVVDGVLKIN